MDVREEWTRLEAKEQWKMYDSSVFWLLCVGSFTRILYTSFKCELATNLTMQLTALMTLFPLVIIHFLTTRYQRREFGILLLLQVYHGANLLYVTNKNQEQFGLTLLFSSVFCLTMEVSWFFNRWVMLFVVNKHLVIWLWAWKAVVLPTESWTTLCAFPTLAILFYMNVMAWRNHQFCVSLNSHLFAAVKTAEEKCEFIKEVLRSVQTGIIVLDSHQEVEHFNNSMLHFLMLQDSSSLVKTMQELIYTEESKKGEKTLMQDVGELMTQEAADAPTDLGLTSLGSRVLEWKASKLTFRIDSFLVLTCNDVTDYIRLQTLEKEESAAKTALLRSVTHELRIPLNAMISVAGDLCARDDLSEEVKTQLSILQTSGNLMLFVTNDLLDFSQIVAGRLSLHLEAFEIRKLVAEVTALLHFEAEKKNLHLIVSVCGRTPQIVYADPNRFAQVLLNLCSNALKYRTARFTQQGAIVLKIEWVPPNQLQVSVRDTGIGIRTEDIGQLFSPFSNLSESGSPNKQGLGLSISDQLVQAMGGSHIRVQSTIGEGSLFFFTLPILESPMPTSPLVKTESVQNVLIIDDNTVNTDVIKSILTKMRVNCDVAHSGAEGIQLISTHKYDSVLLDLDMPDMSGFDTLLRLKELKTEGRTLPPVYAHSGNKSEEQVRVCLAAGFTDFIEKPAPRSKLQTLLLRARKPV